jgi:hypothetical protein
MTRNTALAAILACAIGASAALSIALFPAFASPAEEAAQDYAGWRAAEHGAGGSAVSSYRGESSANLATCPYYPSPVFCHSHALPTSAGRAPAGQFATQMTTPAEARVSLAAARATALATRSGEIVFEELEQERGGSGLRYSFDIRSGPVAA